jgi:hypothetical protein
MTRERSIISLVAPSNATPRCWLSGIVIGGPWSARAGAESVEQNRVVGEREPDAGSCRGSRTHERTFDPAVAQPTEAGQPPQTRGRSVAAYLSRGRRHDVCGPVVASASPIAGDYALLTRPRGG